MTTLDEQQIALALQVTHLNEKMDAIHLSLKEDLAEIKEDVRSTKQEEKKHDREVAQLKGGLIVIAAGLPVVTGLLLLVLDSILTG